MTDEKMSNPEQSQKIELRIRDLSQLFETMDPFPFRERALAREADEYIFECAQELPRGKPLQIVIHLPVAEFRSEVALGLGKTLARSFEYRARAVQQELSELFRTGRWSLVVGLAILATALIIAHVVSGWSSRTYVARYVEEGLIILGWVANWRPLEIFLYDWWPIVHRRNLYRRLADAKVTLAPYAEASSMETSEA